MKEAVILQSPHAYVPKKNMTEAEKAELLLPQTRASQWKRIAGSGSVATGETGKIGVTMPRASYLMLESV